MDKHLDELAPQIEEEIKKLKEVVREREEIDSEDFDLRGELYRLAFEIAPRARNQDLEHMKEWIHPEEGEVSVDLAAGTGFLTIPLVKWTNAKAYAIDPSQVQLDNLNKKKGALPITTIVGSFADEQTIDFLKGDKGNVDIVTSYGGVHHAIARETEQKEIFANVSEVLKTGGRVVIGDVGAGTKLSEHFEQSVKKHCLTGHEEKWLNEDRIRGELTKDTELDVVRIEHVPVKWVFDSERQMAIFMKCLHAYDMSEQEILEDLQEHLGYTKNKNGKWELNWPMLFFELRKR